MQFDAATRQITLGNRACHCGDGTAPAPMPCPKCNGTGNGPKGGRNGCRQCHGMRRAYDQNNRIPCGRCEGTNSIPETRCDSLGDATEAVIAALTFIVHRSGRGQSWNEAHLGMGCLYSVTDYGDHDNMSDDELIAKVRENIVTGYTQAVKVMDDDHRLCDGIVIDCSRSGYAVRSFVGAPMVAPDARTDEFGRNLGMAVYNAGGNGTMAAAMADQATLVPLDPTD